MKSKNQNKIFVLKEDSYPFKQGQILEWVQDVPNVYYERRDCLMVAYDDFHKIECYEYPMRYTRFVHKDLLEPIGWL